MADELKPCPLCGQEASIAKPGCKGSLFGVGCWGPGHIAYGCGDTREKAIEAWNTRTETRVQATIDELVGGLEEAQAALATLINPSDIRRTTVLDAYSLATMAEAKARTILSRHGESK